MKRKEQNIFFRSCLALAAMFLMATSVARAHSCTCSSGNPPTAKCKNGAVNVSCNPVTLPLAAFDNGSTGGTISTTSNLTFGCSNAGSNNIILKVADAAGHYSTCTAKVQVNCHKPTCDITASVGTACMGCGSGGGSVKGSGTSSNPYTIFIGSGMQNITLTGPTSSDISTYSWSITSGTSGGGSLSCTSTSTSGTSTCQSTVFTPSKEGVYTVSLTTNGNMASTCSCMNQGCTSTCSVTICVRDVRYEADDADDDCDDDPTPCDCSKDKEDNKKVYMCHYDAAKSKYKTLKVYSSMVNSHLAHGDYLGKCDAKCDDLKKKKKSSSRMATTTSMSSNEGDMQVTLAPNPSSSDFHITLQGTVSGPTDIVVYDLTGRIIEKYLAQPIGADISVGKDLAPGIYMIGIKQGSMSRMIKVTKQ